MRHGKIIESPSNKSWLVQLFKDNKIKDHFLVRNQEIAEKYLCAWVEGYSVTK